MIVYRAVVERQTRVLPRSIITYQYYNVKSICTIMKPQWNSKAQIRARKTNKKLKCFSPKAQLTDQDDSKNTFGSNVYARSCWDVYLDAFSLVS